MALNIGEANDITKVLRFLSTNRYEEDALPAIEVAEALVRLRDRAGKALQMSLEDRYPVPVIEEFVMEWRHGEWWEEDAPPLRPIETIDTHGRT